MEDTEEGVGGPLPGEPNPPNLHCRVRAGADSVDVQGKGGANNRSRSALSALSFTRMFSASRA